MPTPEVLEFDRLLAPISDEQPAGVETRRDPAASQLFNQVLQARQDARTAEIALFQHSYLPIEDDQQESPKPPDWRTVYEKAIEILANHSKDLWVATWLTEALIRTHGFAGMRDGFRLIRQLCQQYWGSLHPLPDPDDDETVEVTVSQLAGLNDQIGKSPDPIDTIPITQETRSWPALTSFDYEEAQRARGGSAGTYSDGTPRPTLDAFNSAVRESERQFFVDLRDDVSAAQEEFRQLVTFLDEQCGTDSSGYHLAPPTSNITKSLEQVEERLARLTAALFPTEAAAEAGAEAEAAHETAAALSEGAPAGAGGPMRSREDAFRELARVADYFRRSEPHSPISFALDQVIRWGRMSLPELLTELIADSDARRDMFRRTGIPPVDDQ